MYITNQLSHESVQNIQAKIAEARNVILASVNEYFDSYSQEIL